MPIWNRQLWRTAARLHAAYAAAPRSANEFALPEGDWQGLRRLAESLHVAVGRNWTTAASRTREALAAELEALGDQLRDLSVRVQTARRTVPRPHLFDQTHPSFGASAPNQRSEITFFRV